MKGILSGTLVFSILFSIVVPFGMFSSADEQPATSSNIYAFLNKIDTRAGKTEKYNLKLVFKNKNVKDANYYAGPYTDFADVEYVTTTYTFDSTGRPKK